MMDFSRDFQLNLEDNLVLQLVVTGFSGQPAGAWAAGCYSVTQFHPLTHTHTQAHTSQAITVWRVFVRGKRWKIWSLQTVGLTGQVEIDVTQQCGNGDGGLLSEKSLKFLLSFVQHDGLSLFFFSYSRAQLTAAVFRGDSGTSHSTWCATPSGLWLAARKPLKSGNESTRRRSDLRTQLAIEQTKIFGTRVRWKNIFNPFPVVVYGMGDREQCEMKTLKDYGAYMNTELAMQ